MQLASVIGVKISSMRVQYFPAKKNTHFFVFLFTLLLLHVYEYPDKKTSENLNRVLGKGCYIDFRLSLSLTQSRL